MAVKIFQGHTCDECDVLGLPDVPATHHHVISIDGGPFRRLDLCDRSDRAFLDAIVKLYENKGDELKAEPEQEPELKRPERTPAIPKPKTRKKTIEPPKQETRTEDAPASVKPKAPTKPVQYIICTEPHASADGGPLRIVYSTRDAHITKSHPGKKLWDIEWKDPDGILKYPCTSHEECMRPPTVAFTTPQGLSSHRHSSPLPRIDTLEQDVDGHPH